jgi:hypothetical protein
MIPHTPRRSFGSMCVKSKLIGEARPLARVINTPKLALITFLTFPRFSHFGAIWPVSVLLVGVFLGVEVLAREGKIG